RQGKADDRSADLRKQQIHEIEPALPWPPAIGPSSGEDENLPGPAAKASVPSSDHRNRQMSRPKLPVKEQARFSVPVPQPAPTLRESAAVVPRSDGLPASGAGRESGR